MQRAWLGGRRWAQEVEAQEEACEGTLNYLRQAPPATKPCPEHTHPLSTRPQDVPINELHNCGYVSIGCEPCTRPVLPNQQVHAGRPL